MQLVKQSYSGIVQAVAGLGPFARLAERAARSAPYGLERWAASLLAIHDIDRMIALDLPWWNVAATRDVEAHLRAHPGARVFEYGSGASTAWLAARAGSVTSVEHHADWLRKVAGKASSFDHVTLWHRDLESGAYAAAIDESDDTYDLIVVDGRERVACLWHAIPHLRPDGVILFDDSGRSRYRSAIGTCGLAERRYFGRSYCVPYPDHSSILRG
ncbi:MULTISPECIES: class I SAM-dependent methyltransferase [unclassified Sphingopyxis]|uniref:class I SAM-dependent methyltransferase n=1 Tax=unclassified Sphingopyxis TaxID=2614943 RepID=UPI000731DE6B|nr:MULTISPECIES: class I SAM-dependent methyltransferase [unclassified Sphingopyxis]KTE23058.1 hypothetical protein ATE61_18625 [Sphingopyxis sp. H057]KTE49661.1 hypothetical protein ATE64_18640 [Sphingopyxis sp. H073]KTE54194.1 hypothetical protein ATE69_12385 [Sphingopyxis sp. H071]KTE57246.1 hypothetical protein ATE66_18175 [Sphingopyxis sp. H107]KTE60723.1 hypothetical protein ATE65_19095 [Sphingopyxis sp. H100]